MVGTPFLRLMIEAAAASAVVAAPPKTELDGSIEEGS